MPATTNVCLCCQALSDACYYQCVSVLPGPIRGLLLLLCVCVARPYTWPATTNVCLCCQALSVDTEDDIYLLSGYFINHGIQRPSGVAIQVHASHTAQAKASHTAQVQASHTSETLQTAKSSHKSAEKSSSHEVTSVSVRSFKHCFDDS